MENRYITVQYKLYAPMGAEKNVELIEETRPEMPFQFISGMGMVLEALENAIAENMYEEIYFPCPFSYYANILYDDSNYYCLCKRMEI